MVCAVLLDYHAVAVVAASNNSSTRLPCQASVGDDASNHSTQQQTATCRQQKQPTNSTFVIDSILRSSRASLTRRYQKLKGHLFGGGSNSRGSRNTNAKNRHAHSSNSSNSRRKPVLHRSAMSVPTLAKHRSINVHRRSLPDDYTVRPTMYCRPQQQQQQQLLTSVTTTTGAQAGAISAVHAAAQQHNSSRQQQQQQQQWCSTGPPSPFAAYSSSPFAAAAAAVDHPHSASHRLILSSSGRRKIQVTKFNSIQLCRQPAMSLSATAAAVAGGRQLAAGTGNSTATAAAPHTIPKVGRSLRAHFVTNPLTPSQQLPSALDVTISNINRRWLAAKARDIAVIHEFSGGVFYCAPNSEGAVLAKGVLALLQQAAVASALNSKRHMYRGSAVISSGVEPAEAQNKIQHLTDLKTAQSAGVLSGPTAAAAAAARSPAAADVGGPEIAAAAPAFSLISLDSSNSSCGSHTDHISHPNPHPADLIVLIDKRASSNYSSEDPADTGSGSESVSGSRALKTTGSPGGSSNSSSSSRDRAGEAVSWPTGASGIMPAAEPQKTNPIHKNRPVSAPVETQNVARRDASKPCCVTAGAPVPAATQAAARCPTAVAAAAAGPAGGHTSSSRNQFAEAVLYPLRLGGGGVSVSKERQADCTGDTHDRPSSQWFKAPERSYKVVGCMLQRTLSGRSTC